MNRQVNYIIYAFLLLLPAAAAVFFLDNISLPGSTKNEIPIETTSQKELILSESAMAGEILFQNKCMVCHTIFRDMTGPGLLGFEEREPWSDRENVYEWIRNPSAFMKKNMYAKELQQKYGVMMQAFPDLTNKEIDEICEYLKEVSANQNRTMPISSK